MPSYSGPGSSIGNGGAPATTPDPDSALSNSATIAPSPPLESSIPAIPQSGGVGAFFTETAIGRLISRLFGLNPVTVGAQAMTPTALGGSRETYGIDNPRGLDVEFSYHPSELSATVMVNGQPTNIQVEPVYSSTGQIESFRPVTTVDSDRLEQLTGASVMSSEEAVPTQEVGGADDKFEDDGDGLPVRDSSGKVHGVLPTPEQLRGYILRSWKIFRRSSKEVLRSEFVKMKSLGLIRLMVNDKPMSKN